MSTSSSILRLTTISLLITLATTVANAQRKKIVEIEPDTTRLFCGVQVSADAVGVAQLLLSSYGQAECALRVNLSDKWFPIIELGLGKADSKDDTSGTTYKTTAPYGRIGFDYNIAKHKHDGYRIYAGLRYAYTNFKFDISNPTLTDPVWGGTSNYGQTDLKGQYHWIEGVMGVDAKLFGPLRLGWSLRYRRRISHKDGDMDNCWYVPGYGRQGGTRLGGTFNVALEF